MLRSLRVAALTVLCACAEPTGPESPPRFAEARVPAPASSLADGAAELADFSDTFGRILPSFADQVFAEELKAQILSLAAAYGADDHIAAQAALTGARNLLVRSDAHPANLGAIRLALGRVEVLLEVGAAKQSELH